MIVHLWHGKISAENAEHYMNYLRKPILKIIVQRRVI